MKKKRKRKTQKKIFKDYVVVKEKNYGNSLRGTRIYFEGKRPKGLSKTGKINFGKNILELLKSRFDKFRWIVTPDTNAITLERNIYRVRISKKILDGFYGEQISRNADVKNDILRAAFAKLFPEYFKSTTTRAYVPGTVARIIDSSIVPLLSPEDRNAMNVFLPEFISSESLASVNLLKAVTQIKSLKELAANLEEGISSKHSEPWWQSYIHKNILIIQQGYIKAIEKINVSVGNTKFPDFSLVTHDGYLDILEIKRPDTNLLNLDKSRGNHYWDSEMSKAISQVENYIENISNHADAIRSYIEDNYSIRLKVVRPRGIILVGDTRKFSSVKVKNDFRLLCHSCKNIQFLTYDELLNRLKNYIEVLEEHSEKAQK